MLYPLVSDWSCNQITAIRKAVKNDLKTKNSRPRVGRPRALEANDGGDVGREILNAAARLFSVQGYDGTSTREIAIAVGLRQPSIFHYFQTKAAILKALAQELFKSSHAAFAELSKVESEPGPALYAAVFLDARHLAAAPDIARAIARLPHDAKQTMRDVLNARGILLEHIKGILKDGQDKRIFRADNHDVYAHLTLILVEGLVDPHFPVLLPDHHAHLIAEYAVRAVLLEPNLIDDSVAEGTRIVASIDKLMSRDHGHTVAA